MNKLALFTVAGCIGRPLSVHAQLTGPELDRMAAERNAEMRPIAPLPTLRTYDKPRSYSAKPTGSGCACPLTRSSQFMPRPALDRSGHRPDACHDIAVNGGWVNGFADILHCNGKLGWVQASTSGHSGARKPKHHMLGRWRAPRRLARFSPSLIADACRQLCRACRAGIVRRGSAEPCERTRRAAADRPAVPGTWRAELYGRAKQLRSGSRRPRRRPHTAGPRSLERHHKRTCGLCDGGSGGDWIRRRGASRSGSRPGSMLSRSRRSDRSRATSGTSAPRTAARAPTGSGRSRTEPGTIPLLGTGSGDARSQQSG